ncbi:MAG: diaminopimelate epimerase [Chloroflexota bacterium]
MDFSKIQGAGNDFILIETDDPGQDWPQKAVAMCDRHFGIGGDGILLVMPSDVADVRMRMFNPDGSEAEACGNGLRCVVRHTGDSKLAKPIAEDLTVETIAGIRQAHVKRKNGKITEIQVAMGKPGLLAHEIPVVIKSPGNKANDITPVLSATVNMMGRDMCLYFASMGNPHAVYFMREPVQEFPLSQIGPAIERHRMFPSRVNFEIVRVIDRENLEVRVWERGAGETLACGTGACAVAVTAHLLDYIDGRVNINLPGGTLNVAWDGAGQVLLGGPTEVVFTGIWPD